MIQFTAPDAIAPDGSIIGVISDGALSLRDGWTGISTGAKAAVLGPGDAIPLEHGNYILEHTLALSPAFDKARAASHLLSLRRAGATIVLVSHDEALLEACADEIWWVRAGAMVERGDPAAVLRNYRRHLAARLRESGEDVRAALAPPIRNGDGRASLEAIQILDERGQPTITWRSGENAAIAVTVRFAARIEDPVVGIMIRTRIGLNVYGTNTELETLPTGPVEAGQAIRVTFRFVCDLCPGDYTITAASHDPDGIWHDWMEDAVAFSVVDSRYTAGVANLRAKVTIG